MKEYSLPKYDKQREWIRNARANNFSWEQIEYAGNNNEQELIQFLKNQIYFSFWEEISVDDWKNIVGLQKDAEEQTQKINYYSGQAIIVGEGEDNASSVPKDVNSAWQLYRKKLQENGFNEENIDKIEYSTQKLLRRLSADTTNIDPIKGLVIGNVQSGKTANMAALMAMAADWGWNTFIVLSGTIENLRSQTQNRLYDDLNVPGNLIWTGFQHLSKRSPLGQRAQDLNFDSNAKQRYFTVCLKVASRLRNLIEWLQADPNKQKQMKILIIDDEADQASVNTADVTTKEQKTINMLIRNIVHNRNVKSKSVNSKYMAMNYIGYTATPYANILNESDADSLYPKNFISTLSVSNEYFGPQQIFGLEGKEDEFQGLNIVKVIENESLEKIKQIHEGDEYSLPVELEEAICWFLCGVACMRLKGYKKPISMLIHTSQKTEHHKNIASVISVWIKNITIESILKECESIWNREGTQFSLDRFKEEYPNYGRIKQVEKYPEFSEIKDGIKLLLEDQIKNIQLDEEGDLTYHNGLHLCIDNCKNNKITDDGMYVRLAYPTKNNMPSVAPAFIIIGGATLSRGLTIEGLISSFFLRTVGQADTLMQMGRWFGYRKGYELMPRIWLTEKTYNQFRFLALLDQELRDEIHEMDTLGKSPSDYGLKVKNTPKVSFIRITAKNRMQSAIEAEVDYTGAFNQTYKFDNDKCILKHNLEITKKFINDLGIPTDNKECNAHAQNTLIWRNVHISQIKEFLTNYKYHERLSVFNDMENVIRWIEKNTAEGKLDNWNVIFAGKNSKDESYSLGSINVNKVARTRKKEVCELENSVINIGALRAPRDLIADIDLEKQAKTVIDMVTHFQPKYVNEIRALAGMGSIPQLILYLIDKNSCPKENSTARLPLDAKEDIVGLCLNIPGGKKGTNYTTKLTIKLKNNILDENGDIEGVDED